MKNIKINKQFKYGIYLLVLLASALITMVGCGNKSGNASASAETTAVKETKEEKSSEKARETESKKDATEKKEAKEIKEVKASKPVEGGLKQELSTTAKVDLQKNQFTFEVPYSQLHGLKVGDAMVINQGNKAYPAKIMTIPTVDQSGIRPDAKYIITASLGPGVTLPGANVPYTATYLYNNRTPNVHYVNKNYVYYDGPRAYVYTTRAGGRVRKKYIRTGLTNKYYIEILDDWDVVDRIIEDHLDYIDYLEDIIIENIIDDSHDEIIIDYTDYIESLNDRWDFDDEVNEFVVDDVNEIDWKKLEDDDKILNDEDIEKITTEMENQYEESSSNDSYSGGGDFDESSVGLENQYNEDNTSDDSYSGSGDFEESTHEAYVEPSNEDDNDTDGGYSGEGSFDDNAYVTEEETEDHDYSGGGSFDDSAYTPDTEAEDYDYSDSAYSGGGSFDEDDSYSGGGSYSDDDYSGGGSYSDEDYSGGGSFETTEDND
jgi:hypothetical protein